MDNRTHLTFIHGLVIQGVTYANYVAFCEEKNIVPCHLKFYK